MITRKQSREAQEAKMQSDAYQQGTVEDDEEDNGKQCQDAVQCTPAKFCRPRQRRQPIKGQEVKITVERIPTYQTQSIGQRRRQRPSWQVKMQYEVSMLDTTDKKGKRNSGSEDAVESIYTWHHR